MYADVDLGMGFAVPVVACRMSDTAVDMSDIFTAKTPNIFDASFPYYFTVAEQATLVDVLPSAGTRLRLRSMSQTLTIPVRMAYGEGFHKVKMNHRSQRTFNNKLLTYTAAGTNCHGVLELRGLTSVEAIALWNFIVDVLQLNMNPFSIEVLE